MGYWNNEAFDESKALDPSDASITIILTSTRFDIQGSITRVMFNSGKELSSSTGSFTLDVSALQSSVKRSGCNKTLCIQQPVFDFLGQTSAHYGCQLELVSKELNHFGVIADLFRQIGGYSSEFVPKALFEDFLLKKYLKV